MMFRNRLGLCALAATVTLWACSSSGKSALQGSGACSHLQAKPDKFFSCIVKEDPTNKYGWYNLGAIAQQNKDSKTATSDYFKAITIDPRFESALYKLGVIRLEAHNYTDAVALLNRAVAVNPNDADALFKLAAALTHLHTGAATERANAVLRRALKLKPPSPGFPMTPTSK